MEELTEAEKAYIAGFMNSQASVGIHKHLKARAQELYVYKRTLNWVKGKER